MVTMVCKFVILDNANFVCVLCQHEIFRKSKLQMIIKLDSVEHCEEFSWSQNYFQDSYMSNTQLLISYICLKHLLYGFWLFTNENICYLGSWKQIPEQVAWDNWCQVWGGRFCYNRYYISTYFQHATAPSAVYTHKNSQMQWIARISGWHLYMRRSGRVPSVL